MGKLTALAFRNATKPGKYQDGEGLFLLVKSSGARSWLLRVQVDGKRREFGIGPAADIGLADARERASDIRKQYRDGIDPVEAKRAARSAAREIPLFGRASKTVHEERMGSWRNTKHRAQWLSSLAAYAFPSLGNIRVDQVDASAIRNALLPIWLEKPETARRVSQRIGTVLDWAHANGFRQQESYAFRAYGAAAPAAPGSSFYSDALWQRTEILRRIGGRRAHGWAAGPTLHDLHCRTFR